jgi:hypothetical protein
MAQFHCAVTVYHTDRLSSNLRVTWHNGRISFHPNTVRIEVMKTNVWENWCGDERATGAAETTRTRQYRNFASFYLRGHAWRSGNAMWNGKDACFQSFRASSATWYFFLHCAHQPNKTWKDILRIRSAPRSNAGGQTLTQRDVTSCVSVRAEGRRVSSSATYASVDALRGADEWYSVWEYAVCYGWVYNCPRDVCAIGARRCTSFTRQYEIENTS